MKKTIGDIIQKYLLKHATEEEKITEFANFINDYFCDLDEEFIEFKNDFYDKVDEYTEELEDEVIAILLKNLRRKDGTVVGAKWTFEEAVNAMKEYNIADKLKEINCSLDQTKFWVAMNYVYATHYSINRTINGYMELAIDEYANKNICFDKILKKMSEKLF